MLFQGAQVIVKIVNIFSNGSQFSQPFTVLLVELKETNKSLFEMLIKSFWLSFKLGSSLREKDQMGSPLEVLF